MANQHASYETFTPPVLRKRTPSQAPARLQLPAGLSKVVEHVLDYAEAMHRSGSPQRRFPLEGFEGNSGPAIKVDPSMQALAQAVTRTVIEKCQHIDPEPFTIAILRQHGCEADPMEMPGRALFGRMAIVNFETPGILMTKTLGKDRTQFMPPNTIELINASSHPVVMPSAPLVHGYHLFLAHQ